MPRLVINPGTNSAWEVQLKQGINRLGRGFENDFKLEHSSVSGSHCQIVVDSGSVLIKDLGSTNGTFVNRAPVTEAPLQPGQTIHLGGVELLFAGDPPANATVGQTEIIPRPAAPAPTPAAPRLSISAPATVSLATTPPPPAPAVPRLSISAHAAAYPAAAPAAAVVEEAPPPPAPSAATPRYFSGKGNCKFHPKTPARYHCGKCHLFYCDLCVTVRTVGEEQHKFCRKCGTELMNVQVAAREAPKSFFARLPGVFPYPFKGSGLFVLIICTIVISALEFMSGMFSFFSTIVCYGYMFAFMQNIIHSTASEEDQMPSWPSMDDLGGGFTKLAACVVVSFGVPIGLMIYAFFQEEESATPSYSILIPLLAVGCLYFPMALLAVGMKDTPLAANPLVVVPAILKAPLEYLVAVILMSMVLGMRYGGKYVLDMIFGHSLTTHSMAELFAMFGARSLWQFVAVYLLAVNMRILGLLYVSKKEQLGWFSH